MKKQYNMTTCLRFDEMSDRDKMMRADHFRKRTGAPTVAEELVFHVLRAKKLNGVPVENRKFEFDGDEYEVTITKRV